VNLPKPTSRAAIAVSALALQRQGVIVYTMSFWTFWHGGRAHTNCLF
jgi:hypothetical protein